MNTVQTAQTGFVSSGSATARSLILAYHRVTELSSDPQLLCVRPANFAAQLRVLRDCGFVLPLEQVRPATLDAPTRIAVTFDDGYADNYEQAWPILEQARVPATIFVVTGDAGRKREFWWDELEQLLLTPGALPEQLELTVAGGPVACDLGRWQVFTPSDCARFRTWNVTQPPPTARHSAYLQLHGRLRGVSAAERNTALDALAHLRGRPTALRPSHRGLEIAQVRELARHSLVTIGAHTVTHPVLARLSDADLDAEIAGSRAALEAWTAKPVTAFSYPFGGQRDCNPAVFAAVRRAGFTQACANFEQRLSPSTDPLQLPRYLVRDWDGPTFRRRLEDWLSR